MKWLEVATTDERAEDRLFNFRPILFIAIALCLGILFSFLHVVYKLSVWWSCVLLPFACAPLWFCDDRKRAKKILLALLVLLLSFLIGFFSFQSTTDDYKNATEYKGECAVLGVVVNKTDYDEYSRIEVENIIVDGTREDGTLVATLPTVYCETIRVADKILLRGSICTNTSLTDDYGFRAYAIGDNTRYQLKADACTVVGRSGNVFLRIRSRMQSVIYAGMGEDVAPVVVAILTGDVSGIDDGLLTNVRKGGIAHIFAVSGLHIGALYAFSLFLVSKTKLKRPLRFIIVASVLFLYSGICGVSASVVRALVTCLIFYLTKLIGYGSDNLERLGASAIVVLLFSPTSLFEIGFQLSFVACLGIMLLSRPLYTCFYNATECVKGVFGLRKTAEEKENHPKTVLEEIESACLSFLSVTLSAQIATTPLTVYAFGYFSVWSLLLNCLFVPIISACFSFLLLFVFIACLLPMAISAVILYIPNVVWTAILVVFEIVEFSVLTVAKEVFFYGIFVSYYGGLVLATDKWNISRPLKILLSVSFLTCSALLFTFSLLKTL